MPLPDLETDYFIIGAGAAGLAFADTLVTESDAHITIVDRNGQPGGHWNDAYPFVTLHQPSSFYGVNSLELGSGLKDAVGLNKGLYELASGPEICGYFDRVMQRRLLHSGRVHYYPLCNYLGENQFESLLSGARTRVNVRKKLVDATFFSPKVPATHRPRFEVGPDVRVVPPNLLPGLWHKSRERPMPRHFVVLGAGKTAMDTCIWLLQMGAEPDAIHWVVPRDSWLVNRLSTQNGPEFFNDAIGGQANQMEAFAMATSVDDLFRRLEACGSMLRIDTSRLPSMFHSATVSIDEIAMLRRIKNVIRLGRVRALQTHQMLLEQGKVAVPDSTLFIDCTASAISNKSTQPVFQGAVIVPQLVRYPLVSFSAAIAAYAEVHYDDDATKNRLCTPVPFARTPSEYPRTMMANMANQFQWGQDKKLRAWMRESRLDGFSKLMASVDKDDVDKQTIIARLREQSTAALANLPLLMALETT